ncbi:MAG: 50S ribosomal protein L22, partial [Candidatus Micrarchaeota archaeon]|nr:50S ribosomal protein L22 [Candidatus Micrarchaeota archaeon]
MALYEYSIRPAGVVGKAQAHDLDCSYKDLTQVMRAIRDQPVRKAYRILEEAIDGKHAIRYTKFAKGSGHRSELGGKTGRYPKKECRLSLKLLQNAAANAMAQGLEEDSLYVRHAAAYKQSVFRRYRQFWVSGTVLGYGKNATWANYETAHMEIIVS